MSHEINRPPHNRFDDVATFLRRERRSEFYENETLLA
jgi:hypothetical protein